MENLLHRFGAVTAIATLAVAGSTACATKKYLQTTTDDIAMDVTSLTTVVEDVQEQVRINETRIKAVDTSIQTVRQTAQQANQTATEAVGLAKMVESRTEGIENSRRRLVYETVLSADDVTFGFEETELSEAAKNELNALVERLKQETRNILIVVEGHTDSTGPKSVNERIGMDRAWMVEKYLYEGHHIPLTKIDVISHGEERPVAPNTTREGRAQNRRVVIKVIA